MIRPFGGASITRMKAIAGGLLGVALILAQSGMAYGAPASQGFTSQLSCSDGQTRTLINPPGHGQWTPGITVGGVFKPVAFDAVLTVLNSDGSVASTNLIGAQQAHGSVDANNPNATTSCENVSTFTADQDPNLQPGQTLMVDLTIFGFLTGNA